MKFFKSLCLAGILLVMTGTLSFAQMTEGQYLKNLAKYNAYRERLDNFRARGIEQGEGIPASIRHYGYGTILWGDATIDLAYYIGTLAMEYKLLSDQGKNTANTIEELSEALYALYRLDFTAEGPFGCANTGNGFFIRDDVPRNFLATHPQLNDNTTSIPVTVVNSEFVDSTISNKEMSQDQCWHLLIGLALVKKLVPEIIGSTVVFESISLMAQERTKTIIQYMHDIHDPFGIGVEQDWWLIRNSCTNEPVARGADASFLSYGFAEAGRWITGIDLHYAGSSGGFFKARFMDLEIAPSPLPFDYSTLALATICGSCWNNTAVSVDRKASANLLVHFPMLLRVLHGGNYENLITQGFIEEIINLAPCEGPYNFSPANRAPVPWATTSLLVHPERLEQAHLDNPHFPGEYNGLDYMFLFNLYSLVYGGQHALSYATNHKQYPATIAAGVVRNKIQDAAGMITTLRNIQGTFGVNADFESIYEAGWPLSNTTFNLVLSATCDQTSPVIKVQNGGQMILGILTGTYANNTTGKVRIASGTTLKVENGGKIFLNNNSQLVITEGATLILQNGGDLIANNTSKIIIEPGGKLIYESGANIALNQSSILEIKGELHVGDNADFHFAGTGFVRFGTKASGPNIITAGTNAGMTFTGTDQNHKMIEVSNNCALYAPGNLKSFTCTFAKAELGDVASIWPGGANTVIKFQNATLTSNVAGIRNGHTGIVTLGQPNVTIDRCTFSYGSNGVYGLNWLGNNPLKVTNSYFTENAMGVYSEDRYMELDNNRFITNDIAVGIVTPSGASTVKNSVIQFGTTTTGLDGTAGIYYDDGNANSPLYVENATISNPNIGIFVQGGELQLKCSRIQNSYAGLALNLDAVLNASTGLGTGYNNLIGNYFTLYLTQAAELRINNGYNLFGPNATDDYNVAMGDLTYNTFGYSCDDFYPTCKIPIDANRNKWHRYSLLPPVDTYPEVENMAASDYHITTFPRLLCTPGTRPAKQVKEFLGISGPLPTEYLVTYLLKDAAPSRYAGICVSQPTLCLTCPVDPTKAAVYRTINTVDFPNVRLDAAVNIALSNMTTLGGTNDKKAVDLFYQILNYPYSSPNLEEVKQLELSYRKMHEALGNTFVTKAITTDQNQTALVKEVQQVIETDENRLDASMSCEVNYPARLSISLNMAATYRLAGRRELALPVLDTILTFVKPEHIEQVNKLRCQIAREIQVLAGELSVYDYIASGNVCGGNSASRKGRPVHEQKETLPVEESKLPNLAIYPNPSGLSSTMTFSLDAEERVLVEIIDISGKVISAPYQYEFRKPGLQTLSLNNEKLENGIYFVKLTVGNHTQIQKLSVIK